MRPVVLQMGITLDGFVHGDRGYDDWGLPPEEDDVVAWKAASLREAGTHIMGRVTYEDMSAVWPNSTGVFGALRAPLRLDVVEARTFPSGTTIKTCRPLEGR